MHSSMTGYMPTELMTGQVRVMPTKTRNCDMDNATMEGRDESGRTISGPDTTTRRKTGRHSGSDTPITRSLILEQTSIRHKAPTSTAED